MLTRLRVSGFKNLVDVDVHFGPFTCIAGPNGVGKSNLFDAIRFLSALASGSLMDAARAVRDEGGRNNDVRSLFHCVGNTYANHMSFEAEMLVPKQGLDDLRQPAEASITFLRYRLTLTYRPESGSSPLGSIELMEEELSHINIGEAKAHLLFDHKLEWRKSVVLGERRAKYFISTEPAEGRIKRHQDGGSRGQPVQFLAVDLPRTVLSAANAESPTALLAKREMQSWRLLQLEPSALRQPDEFTAPARLGADGSHLAATLYHLSRLQTSSVYGQIANRLSELINDVRQVSIDRDEKRELLTVLVTDKNHTAYPARALSDGTLRFLALAAIELDPETQGVLCLEEPENGIHPERIPAMLRLLQDIATDTSRPVGPDNPLRQVIINTHSPTVVGQVPEDSLLVAEARELMQDHLVVRGLSFRALPDTWRSKISDSISRGTLLTYLNPSTPEALETEPTLNTQPRRVIDRPDIRQLTLGIGTA